MLRKLFYRFIKPLLASLSHLLNRWGITPSQMSVAGLLINLLAFGLLASGAIVPGFLVVLFAGLFDLLDGPLARNSGKVSRFGAFIDSVIDRYSDFLIFGGVLMHFARSAQPGLVMLTLVVIAGALLTSYTKARAEGLMSPCDVGWVERPERIVIASLGGLTGFLVPALAFLAFATHATALQRIHYTRRQMKEGPEPSPGSGKADTAGPSPAAESDPAPHQVS